MAERHGDSTLRREISPTLATWGQLGGVLALLLPVIGTCARILAFAFDHRVTVSGGELGAAQSVPSLAWTGFQCLLGPSAFLVAMVATRRLRHRDPPASWLLPAATHRRSVLKRALRGVVYVIGLSVLLYIMIFWPPWPQAAVGLPLGFVAIVLIDSGERRHPEGRLTLGRLWPALGVLCLGGTLVGGLELIQVPAGRMVFDPGSGVPNGAYSILGMTGTTAYLLPCDSERPMVDVGTPRIRSITPYKAPLPRTPGILALLVGHEHSPVGVFYSCPPRGHLIGTRSPPSKKDDEPKSAKPEPRRLGT